MEFFFAKKKPYFSISMNVITGALPPMESLIFSWIADSIGPEDNTSHLLKLVLLLLAVRLIRDRAYYLYEIDVPGASVRSELRQRLQRQFLGMRGDLAAAWPPGRCVALLDHDVGCAVRKLWFAIFRITELVVSIVASLA